MTEEDAVVLTRYVKALCPQQKFDEYTPDAWHDVLGDLPLGTAREAAAAVARRQPFVSPSEIRDEIRKRRDNQAADLQGPGLAAEVPDADPDDVVAYLAAVRAQRTRAAEGQILRRRPIAELVARIGRATPDAAGGEPSPVRRAGPLGRECPTCTAPIGRACRTDRDRERAPHEARTARAHLRITEETA
ncbi:hypothetical protein ACIQXD_04940 [Streptomyces uncialis]|uniref:zinc finger domain-containing protein n=1 Tax=Streptomyces uncialis TaxID=1048205 RepID=UPI00380C32E2